MLVVLIVLVVSLISCVAGALGGSKDQGQSQAASAGAVSTTVSEAASEASAESADADSGASSEEASEPELLPQSADLIAQEAQKAAAAREGVDDPWVEGGKFATGDAELDQMIKEFCDSNSRDDLNAADNAFNVYCLGMWYEFVERENNQYPTGPTWDITYAKQALTEGSVNCYEQVAFGEYILKYFGYADAYAEPCLILRQSGEYGDHGLLYVTDMDGRKCLCDPAFGANGWMLDADIYTVKLMDVGQDQSEFAIADFEEVVPAPWV